MALNDLPKVRIPKEQKPLSSISKEVAEKRFAEKVALKKDLQKKLKKCEKDLMKYYLTMTKK